MKFNINLILVVTWLSPNAFAQQADIAIVKVGYAFSHVKDTTNRNQPYKENMVLIAGKNASLFTSEDKINQLERMAEFIKKQTEENGGTLTNVVMQKGLIRTVSLTDLYFFSNEKKLVTIENKSAKFRVDEDAPIISWKITKDTANFSGIHCKKATSYFRGRNWIAWFAPDLPFSSGPWKLNSLPGLIIEAYDDRKDIQFSFTGLQQAEKTTVAKKNETIQIGGGTAYWDRETYAGSEIKIPANTVQTTRIELDRLNKAMSENAAAMLNTASGGTTTVKRISGPSTPTIVKSKFNNPIELPEKK
jgi:GLPGLI family protein